MSFFSPKQTTEGYLKDVKTFSANNYKPLPIVLNKGEGIWVWDIEGRKYMDCLSAYSAVNQGHRHPKIIKALKKQADTITLTSRAFHNDQMGTFLKLLCEISGFEMALPMNTGAEAVESAIKLTRKWGYQIKNVPADRAEIIVCENNFHGRTTTIVGFSSEPMYRDGFGPFTPGFKMIPYGSIEALEKAITPETVGFLYEPIQGEGGVNIPPDGFIREATALCRKKKVLVMADEIQTGLGRTGKLYCYEHEEQSKPDLLILGKALGGGVYPVSAVLASREVMGVFKPGEHGSTFGGNPMAAAVGIASLQVIVDEKLPERSLELGAHMRSEMKKKLTSPAIKEIRGKGLMTGIEIRPDFGTARAICEKMAELGFLMKDTHEQVIRVTPPLVIEKREVDSIVDAFKSVLPT